MKTPQILATLALTSMVAACASRGPATRTRPAIYVWESDGNGFNTRTFFYDNGEEVVAFDTQFTPEAARESLRFLRTKTPNPVTFAVVTHPNPDKFNGIPVFQAEGARIVASRETADAMAGVHAYKKYFFVQVSKMFTEETYPKLGRIDQVFTGPLSLRLRNGEVIELSESGLPGVSTNQTVAFVKSQGALFVGDLVHHRAHAWLEGGIVRGRATPTLPAWIQNLRGLAKTYPSTTTVYGGRGVEAPLAEAVPAQIAYLERAEILVREAVRGGPVDFAALAKRFEAAFPGYALPYMIQYGAYSLADQLKN